MIKHDPEDAEIIHIKSEDELHEKLVSALENCDEELNKVLDTVLDMETFTGMAAMVQAIICIASQAAPSRKSAMSLMAFFSAYMMTTMSNADEAHVCRWNKDSNEKMN
jgi:hypothetical protein